MCNRFNIAIFFIFMFSVSYANAEFSQNKSYKLTPVCGDPFDDKSSTLVESSASFNTQHIDGFIDDSLVDCIETFYNKKSDFKYNVTFLLSSKGGSVKQP